MNTLEEKLLDKYKKIFIEYFSCTYCIKQLPLLKKEFSYLNDVDSISLQQAIRHLDTAYQNFYKKHTYIL